jgi:flagellar hook protein FlgE
VQQGGSQLLTRAGNFQLDSYGNLQTVNGEQVMGYGTVNGVPVRNGVLVPLQLPIGTTESANPTKNFSITANLNAAATVGTQFSTPVTIYDSLGQSHVATVQYTKTAANTWNYSITLPTADATGISGHSGALTFDSAGNLQSPTTNVPGLNFTNLADGASDITMNWNLYDASGNGLLTQSTAPSSSTATTQDGYASGAYQGFSVDSDGTILASYSNSNTVAVGQLAIASASNEQGLIHGGNNDYKISSASGPASIGVAGTGSRGTIEDGTLEESNVDIATEFSELIVAQRSFEANSKTVTTFDTIAQDTISMIR